MSELFSTLRWRFAYAGVILLLASPDSAQAREGFLSTLFKKKPKPEIVVPKATAVPSAPRPASSSTAKNKTSKKNTPTTKKTVAKKKSSSDDEKKDKLADEKKTAQSQQETNTLPPESVKAQEPPKPPPPSFARPVMGRKGFVYPPGVPHTAEHVVDVTGMAPGQVAKDPRTGQAFLVP